MPAAREERFYFALQLAAARLRADADQRCLERGGVTAAQAAALAVVRDHPGITQRSLARALHLAEPSVTTLVRRLLAAGLVERALSSSDGRAWSLTVTDAGNTALAGADAGFAAVNERVDAVLSEPEVRQVAAALRRLLGEP
jgi:DNA-binding MarR family transcriptional regulator